VSERFLSEYPTFDFQLSTVNLLGCVVLPLVSRPPAPLIPLHCRPPPNLQTLSPSRQATYNFHLTEDVIMW
jgi:hypothetical protein